MGATGGLLLAFICFEMFPKAFDEGGLVITIAGMLSGVVLTAFLESKIAVIAKSAGSRGGALLAVGVALHNIPEGLAIGALFAVDSDAAKKLALLVAIHCLPEGLAVFLPMKRGGMKTADVICLSLAFGFPMGLGAALGGIISTIAATITSGCLGLAGGVMLYIICGDILPESKKIWNGRLTTIGAMLGFAIGVILTAGLL